MNETNIIELLPSGLIYKDERGEIQFIDFADCYQKRLAEKLNRLYENQYRYSEEEYQTRIKLEKAFREVGIHDFGEILFHTDPPICFVFDFEDWKLRTKLFYDIFLCGWALYDWT